YMCAVAGVGLGRVGRNFAAGMSDGVAYVLDETEVFMRSVNHDMVDVLELEEKDDMLVTRLVHEHAASTGSVRALEVLEAWERYRQLFRKVVSHRPLAALPAPAPARQLSTG